MKLCLVFKTAKVDLFLQVHISVAVHSCYVQIFFPSGSFQFLSPLSTTSTEDSIAVTWTPPKLSPTGYKLNTICSGPCDDDIALPHTTSTPGPADTSATITGLLPGSMCTITLTALFGDIVSDTVTTKSETLAHGSKIDISLI